MIRLLVVFLLVLILGCDTAYSFQDRYVFDTDADPACNVPIKKSFVEILYVSDQFNDIEKDMIEMAIQKISFATNGVANIKTVYSDNTLEDIPKEANEVVIMPLADDDEITQQIDDMVGGTIIGYYDDVNRFDPVYRNIYIVNDRLPGEKTYELVVMHEILHSAGLGHINQYNSVMYKYANDTLNCITESDMIAFCEIYNCNIRDMNYCNDDKETNGICKELDKH